MILKPLAYRKGYVKIHLGKCNGTRPMQRKFLHRMVWEAFNGPIPRGLTINHKNGVKSDNRLENLEVMTNLENHIHSRSLRTRRWKTADGWVRARLTPEDVREIRSLYATGAVTYNQLASAFGVVKGTIGHILSGRYWKHVD